MGLKFVLGKAQSDKYTILLQDLKRQITQHPQDQYIWLVPNHIKFESEVNILNALKDQKTIFATNQVQVFSFSRLAWYFLRNDPLYQAPQLTITTQAMILAQIVQHLAPQLHLYAGEAQRYGFIATLQLQINELITGNLTDQRLKQLQQNLTTSQGDLALKMADLQKIYEAYQAQTQGRYNDGQQLLKALGQYLIDDPQQQHYHYFISNFSQFNAQELQFIKIMLQRAASVEISLTLDHPYSQDQESIFFQQPRQTFLELFQWARQQQIPIITQTAHKPRVGIDLAHLEDFWIAQQTNITQTSTQSLVDHSAVQIWTTTTLQKEVAAVTTYIRQMVATQGYRYRDFLVLARNLDDYQQFLEPYFTNQGISYFMDLQHSMKDHAFKDLIDSLFDLQQNNLQYLDVMRFLRTELVVPQNMTASDYRQAVDLTDNYILAHGLRARDWLSEADFTIDSENTQLHQQLDQINQIKNLVKTAYQAINDLVQGASDCQSASTQLYELLDNLAVFANLKKWEQKAIAAGDITLSQQPQQIVKTFAQLLDEYVTIFGEDSFNAQEFLVIIDNGFEQAQYSTIPSVLDSVHISGLTAVQNNQHLITIIMGANEVDMPQVNINRGLLSDDDLELLQPLLQDDEKLSPTQQQLNSNEPYLHNLAFLSGSQRLIFTYASTKAGNEVHVSPYVELIKQHFNLQEQVLDYTKANDEQQVLSSVGSPTLTLNNLLAVYRQAQDQKQPVALPWQKLHDILFAQTNTSYLQQLWSSLNYQNIPESLTPQISQELYGNHLTVSISQLETYYQNPYEYFLRYGLNLRPREEFKITPANQGTFFHEVMDRTIKTLQQNQQTIKQLSAEELHNLSQRIINQILEQKQYRIFSHEEKFIRQRMIRVAQQSLEALRLQARLAAFDPYKTEVAFGQVGALHNIEPLRYDFGNHQDVVVRGRIDRIDRLAAQPNNYFVVDYKSSERKFKFDQFYAGINLQMITYLASLINDPSLFEGPATALGGFYFHLQNATVNFEDLHGQLDNYQDYLFKNYKYKGLIIDDGQAAQLLDSKSTNQVPLIFPLTKGHKISSPTAVSPKQFTQMLEYNQFLIKQAAQNILTGDNRLSPLREDQQTTALQYSDYLSIMQFDAMLPENNYRLLEKLDKKAFFKRLDEQKEHK